MLDIENYTSLGLDEKMKLIAQFENTDTDKNDDYIEYLLLPLLDKSYQISKDFLKNSSRSKIYNIKKALVDLMQKGEAVKISNIDEDDDAPSYLTKYTALYSMLDALNTVYIFAAVLRQRIQKPQLGDPVPRLLAGILRDIKELLEEVQRLVEQRTLSMF